MSAVPRAPIVSPEEYLDRERVCEIRHEYFRGEVFAMSGGSREHSLISGNFQAEVRTALGERPCEVHGSDMRIKVVATGLFTYPDGSVVCGEPLFDDHRRDTILNPIVLAEVLSRSTEAYDRGDKFAHYRRIESLREFVLISQDRVRVERYLRQGDDWLLTELSSLDDSLRLESIDCLIPLRQIYRRIQFSVDNESSKDPPHHSAPSNPISEIQ